MKNVLLAAALFFTSTTTTIAGNLEVTDWSWTHDKSNNWVKIEGVLENKTENYACSWFFMDVDVHINEKYAGNDRAVESDFYPGDKIHFTFYINTNIQKVDKVRFNATPSCR